MPIRYVREGEHTMNQYEMMIAISQMLREAADAQVRDVDLKREILEDGASEITVTWQIMGLVRTYKIKISEVK
jgi:hypothetical protein